MKKIKCFFNKHKSTFITIIISVIVSAIVAIAVFSSIMFGYYKVSPQDVANITIQRTEIQGTKEDGSQIYGFLIKTEDGTEYLVTDYWNPIALTDDIPEVN